MRNRAALADPARRDGARAAAAASMSIFAAHAGRRLRAFEFRDAWTKSDAQGVTRLLTFQEIILELQNFWSKKGCAIVQPYDLEKGAGTF